MTCEVTLTVSFIIHISPLVPALHRYQFNVYGAFTFSARFEIEPVWDDAQFFSEGLAYVEQEGKKGFINKKGDMVICDSLLRFEMPCINGLIIVRNADRDYGLIDKKGKFVVNPQFKAMIPDGDWYINSRTPGIRFVFAIFFENIAKRHVGIYPIHPIFANNLQV